jgi:hypothetical protein
MISVPLALSVQKVQYLLRSVLLVNSLQQSNKFLVQHVLQVNSAQRIMKQKHVLLAIIALVMI